MDDTGQPDQVPTPAHAGRSRAGRDEGFTMVEIVITITLMAALIAPIMAAVMMAISESSRSRSAAQVETALINAADRVNRAWPARCDTYDVYVKAAVQSLGWESDRASAQGAYYVPGANPSQTGTWVGGELCAEDEYAGEVQRVHIVITSPDGRVTRSIDVVKSNV